MRYLLIILLFASCQKPETSYRPNLDAKIMALDKDTTISGIWDGGGRVLRITDHIIHGTGTLQNWIIDASAWQQIFDSSLTIQNIKIYEGDFSAMWIGASSVSLDNWNYLQKSIDICKNNFPLRIPAGTYKYSKPLTASTYPAFTYLNMYGDGDIWNGSTTLIYTGVDKFAFGIQLAKGGSLHNITFTGQFVAPVNNGKTYYALTQAQYNDVSGKCSKDYSGIVIDYDSTGIGGSTAFKVYDVSVSGFDILFSVSPNPKTFNADVLSFTNLHGGNGRIMFQSSEAQEKGNTITNIVCWANIHTLISLGNAGKNQAGSYTIQGGNIASGCIRLFNVDLQGWNAFAVNGLTAESIGTIGNIYTGDSRYTPIASLNDLRIRFALQPNAGVQTLLTSNSVNVRVTNSTLWYYGAPADTLHFRGPATMTNNNYSGPVIWQ